MTKEFSHERERKTLETFVYENQQFQTIPNGTTVHSTVKVTELFVRLHSSVPNKVAGQHI